MSTTPSADARAVVKAVAALTTQVGRIADALTTPVVRTEVVVDDDVTTPLDEAVYCPLCPDAPRLLTPADADHHFRTKHPEQRLNTSGAWPLLVPDEGPRCVECGSSAATYRNYRGQPFCGRCANGERQAPPDDEHERCITHFHVACDGTTRDCAFPTPGTGRRRSLRVLLNRLNNGVALTPDEVQLLTRHVATEITEHNTARAVAAGNKRHVQILTPALQRAEADANHNADQVADAVRRAESAERDLRTLRAGIRAAGGDPTQIQNLWAQLRMRNRQWAEAKREARAFRDMLEDPRDVSLVDEMLATVAAAEEKAREARHERDVIAADLETADQIRAEVQRDRDQHAAVLAEVLGRFSHAYNEHGTFTGHQCTSIPDETFQRWHSVVAPTVERPWWEQAALYEKEAVEATRHVLELKAAIERVRNYLAELERAGWSQAAIVRRIRAALDGTEEPTIEEPAPPAGNLAAYQAAIARVALVLREQREHREQTDPSERQDCVMCGADHFAEIRDAVKGKQPDDTVGLHAKLDEATATLRRVRTVTKDWEHQVLPHSEAHRLLVEVRDALVGPRPDGTTQTEH